MKHLLFSALLFLVVSLLGCQDSKEDNVVLADISAIKKIGTQISVETGNRWMAAYRDTKLNNSGRLLLADYSISKENLQAARASVPTFVGFAFHHAIDDYGVHHFILIPIGASLSLWSSYESQLYIDANSNTAISAETARAWSKNYEEANPDSIWFHFFGSNIFDEMVQISYFQTMDIEPAINDLNLTPQLLLIVNNLNILDALGGRVESESTVYDASSPCPPCPVR